MNIFKLSKTKSFENFPFFLYSVQGAVIGGNFTLIGEYSSIVKNRRKWVIASVMSARNTNEGNEN
jgi:hypothetical protein